MAINTWLLSNSEKCLCLLAEYMYSQQEWPTIASLRQAAQDRDKAMLEPNVLSSYFGTLEKALDKAEAYLKKLHPEWVPPWSNGAICSVKPKVLLGWKASREAMMIQKGVGVIKAKSKERVFSEEERYYLDMLIGACQENDGVLPTWRQIEKDSFINSKKLMKVLGKGRGWAGIIYDLKVELKRQGIEYTEAEEDNGSGKSSKKKKQKGQVGSSNEMQAESYVEAQTADQIEAQTEVEASVETHLEEDSSPVESQVASPEASGEATTAVVAKDTFKAGETSMQLTSFSYITVAASCGVAPEPVESIEEPVEVEDKNEETQPEMEAKLEVQLEMEPEIQPEVQSMAEPKKRRRRPQSFNRDEEIAKLCEYQKLLNGKYPTPARLQKLAKMYPNNQITCGATLEKRLGSYKEWPALIDDYIARQSETEKPESQ